MTFTSRSFLVSPPACLSSFHSQNERWTNTLKKDSRNKVYWKERHIFEIWRKWLPDIFNKSLVCRMLSMPKREKESDEENNTSVKHITVKLVKFSHTLFSSNIRISLYLSCVFCSPSLVILFFFTLHLACPVSFECFQVALIKGL